MINRYDTFSRLKKVILGKINFSLADTVTDENERLILKDILYQIDDTLKQIEKIFLDFRKDFLILKSYYSHQKIYNFTDYHLGKFINPNFN